MQCRSHFANQQELPPRQRAMLLLGDVLGYAETATLVCGPTASVNIALQGAEYARQALSGRPATGYAAAG